MLKIHKQLLLVIILTTIADFLFYSHTIGGASLTIYSTLLLIGISFCEKGFFQNKKVVLVSILNLTLIIATIIAPNFWSISLSVICFFSIMILLREGWIENAIQWCLHWISSFFLIFTQWLRDLPVFWNWLCNSKNRNFKGYFVALFFSMVFIFLFAIANPIIEVWVIRLYEYVSIVPEPSYLFFWFSFLVCTWSFLRLEKKKQREIISEINNKNNDENNENKENDEDDKKDECDEFRYVDDITEPEIKVLDWIFTPATIVICLTMFNIIFGLQTVLDIFYLWGGISLPEGMTVATYAHRGSYPLIFTVLLAAFFVLITFRQQTKEKNMQRARFLVYTWLVQNVFLTISAFLRLELYIEVYNLTRWRIAALLWMGIIALGLLWILMRIVKEKSGMWLININFITVFFVFYICAFANIDGFIANYNVSNSEFQVEIDVQYLESLGVESLPALIHLQKNTNSEREKSKAIYAIGRLQKKLQRQLGNWRGWCYRYHDIQSKLK